MIHDLIVMFDVDNTLLNNDRVQADLDIHMSVEHGTAARNRYWEIFGYRTGWWITRSPSDCIAGRWMR